MKSSIINRTNDAFENLVSKDIFTQETNKRKSRTSSESSSSNETASGKQ